MALQAGHAAAPEATQDWLDQLVYEIVMLRFADRFAAEHAADVTVWREQSLGTEGVLVHARILHSFLSGPRGAAVPCWEPFGSAADFAPTFAPAGFLTDAEFEGIAGALGRFGSYSTGSNNWKRGELVKRAIDACLAFADALRPHEGDVIRRICTADL
jgi:hypothetical protein